MSNFLDLRCPECGDEDHLDILADVWLRVTPDGTDADVSADGHHDYTPRSLTLCNACGHTARLSEFETEEVQS